MRTAIGTQRTQAQRQVDAPTPEMLRSFFPALIATLLIVAAADSRASDAAALSRGSSGEDVHRAPDAHQGPDERPVVRVVKPAVVQQPRSSGYFVGDVFTQKVLLPNDAQGIVPDALAASGRVNSWFERRGAKVETDASGHRWLVLQYQILNAPSSLTAVTLPAWNLPPPSGTSSATAATVRVPAVSINVAPLSPPASRLQLDAKDLRPDRLPSPVATGPIVRALTLCATALGLTLLAWVGWLLWLDWRATFTQPFASALREMRRLDDREPRAWQTLHRAFDRTAGRVVHGATLSVLFERAPQLASLRGQIERFFELSSQRFFGSSAHSGGSASVASGAAAGATAAPLSPRALCAELRRIERRWE